jgi:hypothetical protein
VQRRLVRVSAPALPYFDFVESFGALDDVCPARRISLVASGVLGAEVLGEDVGPMNCPRVSFRFAATALL